MNLGIELSQLLALIYTSSLDHYIKEKLQIKYYLRYVDDGIIIHSSIPYLYQIQNDINSFLLKLDLKLNINKTHIINFEEYNQFIFLKTNFIINKKIVMFYTCKSIKHKLKQLKTEYLQGKKSLKDIQIIYSSWRNYVIYGNNYKYIKIIDNLFNQYFNI